jgi:hypothetical protein
MTALTANCIVHFGGGDGSQVLQYIALGDSYASGPGIGFDTAPGPVGCYRSHLAYSGRLAGALHSASGKLLRPVNVACHGAEIRHYELSQPVSGIEGPQRDHLSRESTGLVTVSMSGNDLRFPDIVRACLTDSFCGKARGEPLATPQELMTVQVQLARMYTDILSRIRPDGQLVVLTYPNIVPLRFDETCLTAVDQDELNMLADLVDEIRDTVEDAVWMAGSPRIRLVDMSDKFTPPDTGSYANEIARTIGLVLPIGS